MPLFYPGRIKLPSFYPLEQSNLGQENEDKLQAVLDSMYFCRMTSERITVNRISEFTVI